MDWLKATVLIVALAAVIGVWFLVGEHAQVPTGPISATSSSPGTLETYLITAVDSGKTFSYPLTTRFMLELDATKYPPEDLRSDCAPPGTLGRISNIPAVSPPLYVLRFEAAAPGECAITNGAFSVHVIAQGSGGAGGILPYNSGIRGAVLLGPTCPVMQNPPSGACADKPYATTVSVYRATSTAVFALTQSDTDGTFQFSLPPGTYTVSAAGGSPLPRCAPQTVVVGPSGYASTTISCDTGIR